MPLPRLFCWTRFGTEAGEPIEDILRRKEEERHLNGGVFLWGIGNAIGPSLLELIRLDPNPQVIFSPIRSSPKTVDVSPEQVAVWAWGETLWGEPFTLPEYSVVTSRFALTASQKRHYALVCHSDSPLSFEESLETIPFGALRNLCSGRLVGASQVTAIVSQTTQDVRSGPEYRVAIRASLVYPYFLQLQGPVPIGSDVTAFGVGRDYEAIRRAVRNAREASRSEAISSTSLCLPGIG